MSDDADLARISGIDTERVVRWTWLIGGGLAAAAGVFAGINSKLHPSVGWDLLLPLFAAAILGGIGKPYGAIVGGLAIGVAQEVATYPWIGDNPLVANGVHGESGATNLGPRSSTLLADTRRLVAYWHSMGVTPTPDLVTTSGSGYDPDISPQDARAEIPMVSRATGLSRAVLTRLIDAHTVGPQFGFLGSGYLNVLQLNEALAKLE